MDGAMPVRDEPEAPGEQADEAQAQAQLGLDEPFQQLRWIFKAGAVVGGTTESGTQDYICWLDTRDWVTGCCFFLAPCAAPNRGY